jgi:hypothetical protein
VFEMQAKSFAKTVSVKLPSLISKKNQNPSELANGSP